MKVYLLWDWPDLFGVYASLLAAMEATPNAGPVWKDEGDGWHRNIRTGWLIKEDEVQ